MFFLRLAVQAERQLRLLFETAGRLQPSIIFFDEIDGLAPVRSSKQGGLFLRVFDCANGLFFPIATDQIHSSIVATLLALLDGLDDR